VFSEPVTEQSLLLKEHITPDEVLRLTRITEQYLCPPEANIYEIDFIRFKIRDLDTGLVLCEIAKPTMPPPGVYHNNLIIFKIYNYEREVQAVFLRRVSLYFYVKSCLKTRWKHMNHATRLEEAPDYRDTSTRSYAISYLSGRFWEHEVLRMERWGVSKKFLTTPIIIFVCFQNLLILGTLWTRTIPIITLGGLSDTNLHPTFWN